MSNTPHGVGTKTSNINKLGYESRNPGFIDVRLPYLKPCRSLSLPGVVQCPRLLAVTVEQSIVCWS